MNATQFQEKFPQQVFYTTQNHAFPYRYYHNPRSDTTILILTGAIGLSDLMADVFSALSRDFSVLTFDYPQWMENTDLFCQGVRELLLNLQIRVWVAGQSLGGLLAQILAKAIPEQIQGLILINTGTLEGGMPRQAYHDMMKLIHLARAARTLFSLLPFQTCRNVLIREVQKKAQASPDQKEVLEQFASVIGSQLTRDYALHMIDLLLDTERSYGLQRKDFDFCRGNVLLLQSQDDTTFPESCRKSLIHVMPDPEVISDIRGGHMALFRQPEFFAGQIRNFILPRTA